MTIKDILKNSYSESVEIIIDTLVEWPPGCVGIMFQPERPLHTQEELTNDISE